jgi:hypothetical protein
MAVTARKNQPVFVIGCHRSGTALLYDSLLSAGGFPLYHAAPFLHSTLLPMSGDPSVPRNRERMMQIWLRSKPFRRTGLDPAEHGSRILKECKNGGDFLRITLGELARLAGVPRWASYDIDNIMHMAEVKREVSDALFVHVVRDGRDVAVSMKKQHGADRLWWAQERALYAWALLWRWTVRKGRRCGTKFPDDYLEVSYEDLVREPETTLRAVGEFLDHDLDYGRIQKNSVGRVAAPNTVWTEESSAETFHSIGRWKNKLSPSEIGALEALIGDGLEEFGYCLSAERRGSAPFDSRLALMRIFYPRYFDTKLFVKSKTVLGRLLVNGDRLELTDPVREFCDENRARTNKSPAQLNKSERKPQMIEDLYLVRGAKRALGLHVPGRMLDVFPDDTFLVSYPKSGNTWIRFLIANLKYPERHPDFTNLNELVPDNEAHTKRSLNQLPRPRILKSQQYFDPRYPKVLYLVRDPRDVVLAEYHFAIKQRLHGEDYPLADYVPRFLAGDTGHAFGSWFDHLSSWYYTRRHDPGFLLVRYESLHSQPMIEMERIAKWLGAPADPARLKFAIAQSTGARMRELEKKQGHLYSSTKDTRQDLPYIRVAKAGGWRRDLPQRSVNSIELAWGGLMEEVGYRTTVSAAIEAPAEREDYAGYEDERTVRGLGRLDRGTEHSASY